MVALSQIEKELQVIYTSNRDFIDVENAEKEKFKLFLQNIEEYLNIKGLEDEDQELKELAELVEVFRQKELEEDEITDEEIATQIQRTGAVISS